MAAIKRTNNDKTGYLTITDLSSSSSNGLFRLGIKIVLKFYRGTYAEKDSTNLSANINNRNRYATIFLILFS